MGDVIELCVTTTLDIPPEKLLASAATRKFQQLLIIGYLDTGELHMQISMGAGAQALWLLERAKTLLMEEPDQIPPEPKENQDGE